MTAILRALVAVALMALPPIAPPALAHHVMGGELPRTAWQGLLSGLGHPIIGIDHLAFVLGVGLMAHLAGRVVRLPLLFVAGTVLGCVLHVLGYDLPAPEAAIALTVAIAAAVVAWRANLPPNLLAPLLAAAGLFHGYAYGESIVGAEPAPLAAYLVGFALIQGGIAVGSAVALRVVAGRGYLSEVAALRAAGGVIALAAAFAFAGVVLAG
jgi:urease accessory protein